MLLDPAARSRLLRKVLRLAVALALGGAPIFAHADPAGTVHYPDFENLIPTNQMSIVLTPEGREFRYTHQLFNSGAGPLEIQPAYNFNAGVYQGVQQLAGCGKSVPATLD